RPVQLYRWHWRDHADADLVPATGVREESEPKQPAAFQLPVVLSWRLAFADSRPVRFTSAPSTIMISAPRPTKSLASGSDVPRILLDGNCNHSASLSTV